MDKIPPGLVKALTELGLLESEAKIYVALVMMNHSEVKDLIDFLDMSKPNTYESLRSLEERGLIVAVSERPIVYQAVAPEIGLEMLVDRHLKAKAEAEKLFSTVHRDIRENPPDDLWYIFSEKNVEYKIRDMVAGAKKSAYVAMSDRYIDFIRPLARKNIDLHLLILSSDPATRDTLKKMFVKRKVNLQYIDRIDAERIFSGTRSQKTEELVPPMAGLAISSNLDKTLMLIVDDAETLYIPPVFDSMNAITSRGKGMVQNLKNAFETMSVYFSR
jgi:HTH-type transcriptional regulator, sugar sensing transcriptional regulator